MYITLIDIVLVFVLVYTVLSVIRDRRTMWMVQGLMLLMAATLLSRVVGLRVLSFLMDKILLGASVSLAVMLVADFRRLLESIGKGEFAQLFTGQEGHLSTANSVIDELVEAVKGLSQNRTGALMILETDEPIEESDFSVPGVRLNAELSRELLQTIFQTTTLLHDGAVLIRGSRILAAGVILPISERDASRQLGTRHRAAMGITERVEQCLCVVVSEETGSISVAEKGTLNRPLTSSKLKELLTERFSPSADADTVAPQLRSLGKRLSIKGLRFLNAIGRKLKRKPERKLPSPTQEKK
ncbi:diadenylate cyclase CdaA [cf. Phormidesmis sp. LEGE 11477]|uniref:diadenylate cyclase CdaA n=1 Tax=cf. Phormidesmis sp. LEGE 11477 TaxID=1828680 RepID=UPI001881A0D3|nr:diadenylate cyclase CdaA [cf. Phormidesmis sp. LEGE 11477]MBE9062066.1 TIGR00159 family protein [cf. Phormidesmis sp. LEGE 11477]